MTREATPVATAIITTFGQIDCFGFGFGYDDHDDDKNHDDHDDHHHHCRHYIGDGKIGDLFLTHQRGDSHLF